MNAQVPDWDKIQDRLSADIDAIIGKDLDRSRANLLNEAVLLWQLVQAFPEPESSPVAKDHVWKSEWPNATDLSLEVDGRKVLMIEGKYLPPTDHGHSTKPTDMFWGLMKDVLKLATDGSSFENKFLILFVCRDREAMKGSTMLDKVMAYEPTGYKEHETVWKRLFDTGSKIDAKFLDEMKTYLPKSKKVYFGIKDEGSRDPMNDLFSRANKFSIEPVFVGPNEDPIRLMVWQVRNEQ